MDPGTLVQGPEPLDFDDFLLRLRSSGLLSAEQLSEALPHDDTQQPGVQQPAVQRVEALTSRLLESGLLTPWQHRMLVEGRGPLTLGRYRLLDELTRGGMARVYLAEHMQMRRRVALKVYSDLPDIKDVRLQRFLVESRAAASLDHPHVARTYHFDWEGDLYYLVMEFVEGPNLDALVEKQGPLDAALAAEYIRQAADGLAHAHAKGLIHRDVKPANLMLTPAGVVKVLDLGLARFLSPDEPMLTQDQGFLGTVDYVAPEQIVNSHDVDVRADVYGLGGTLYFLLTGHAPYHEYKLFERLHRHLYAAPRDIRLARPDAPLGLIALCEKMMAKSPADRFQTAAEVELALRTWLAAQSDSHAAAFDRRTIEARAADERMRTAISALAAGAAHRFNNILQCLEGDLSMAREALSEDSPLARRLDSMESAVHGATELTQQLQICAGKNPAVAVPCRLGEILSEIKRMLAPALPERISLTVTCPALSVLADVAQLRTLILNLISNAHEAMGERNGKISLRAGLVDGAVPPRVFLEVEDDGSGMHEETRQRAFDPFFSTRSPERGLGLAVALGIAKSFDGELTLSSKPGKGTTARLMLPQAAIPTIECAVSKGCVLVVEDDKAIRELMARALSSAGFTVMQAKDGNEAVAIYRHQPDRIDVVVLDMWMPGMNGETLFQELRAIRANVRAIVASGSLDRPMVERLTKLGLAGVIQKPYQPFALVEKIFDVLPTR